MQLTRNVVRKYAPKVTAAKAAIGTAFLSACMFAHAALPENVETDVATAKADMLLAIGIVIGAMVAVWGLLKLAGKLGWK